MSGWIMINFNVLSSRLLTTNLFCWACAVSFREGNLFFAADLPYRAGGQKSKCQILHGY